MLVEKIRDPDRDAVDEDDSALRANGIDHVQGSFDRFPMRRTIGFVAENPFGHFRILGSRGSDEEDRTARRRREGLSVSTLAAAGAAENESQQSAATRIVASESSTFAPRTSPVIPPRRRFAIAPTRTLTTKTTAQERRAHLNG